MVSWMHSAAMKPRLVGRWPIIAVVVALACPILAVLHPTRTISSELEESAARLFAAHVLDLRAAGVAGEARAEDVLAAIPGSGMIGTDALPHLWSPFFANSVVKLGRVQSARPVALYYDPLLDIAILAYWMRAEEMYHVTSVRAMPGERLEDPDAPGSVLPSWMTGGEELISSLASHAESRLGAFSNANPIDAREPGQDNATFAAAAADMRAVLPRLAWSVGQRERWVDGTLPWLELTLATIENALASGDAGELIRAAPGTGEDTAEVLAGLPPEFFAGLVLDMVLKAEGGGRILIGSLPGDGDVYVLVLCRLEEEYCALNRFMLASLLE